MAGGGCTVYQERRTRQCHRWYDCWNAKLGRCKMAKKAKKIKHIGFKAAAAKAAKGAGVSLKRGAAIIAAGARKGSAQAERPNPRVKRGRGQGKRKERG